MTTDAKEDILGILEKTKSDAQAGNFANVMKVLNQEMDTDDPSKLMIMVTLANTAKQMGRDDVAYNIFTRVYNKLSSGSMLGPEHEDVVSLKYSIGMVTNSLSESYKCLTQSFESATRNGYNDLEKKIKKTLDLFMENLPQTHKSLYNKLYNKLNIKHNNHTSNKPTKGTKQHLTDEELDTLMLEFDLN